MALLRDLRIFVLFGVLSPVALTFLAEAQEGTATVFLPNQKVVVNNLPPLVAPSTDRAAGLGAALEIVVHDKAVCCGKNSALEDAALYATLSASVSLKELSTKLQGRHLLSDGRPILVNAQYLDNSSINAGFIVGSVMQQHPMLIEWRDHVYVLYGAIFDVTRDTGSGVDAYAIHKLMLLDPRFSDGRRLVEFNRDTDDWTKVGSLLVVTVVPQ